MSSLMNLSLSDAPPKITPSGPVPDYKLYDADAVTVAAVIGGPLAAAMVIGVNYWRLGQKGEACGAVLVGVGIIAVALLFGDQLPSYLGYALIIPLILAARRAAVALQGPAVEAHRDADGQMASNWGAVGLSLLALLVVGAGLALMNWTLWFGPKVTIGSKDVVFYSGSTTRSEAQALGDSLKEQGFFQDIGANVFLDKDKDGTTIGVVLKDGFWDQPGVEPAFEDVMRKAAPAVGGLPVHMQLMNSKRVVEREATVN